MKKSTLLLVSQNESCLDWCESVLSMEVSLVLSSRLRAVEDLSSKNVDLVLLDSRTFTHLELQHFYHLIKMVLGYPTYILCDDQLVYLVMDSSFSIESDSFIQAFTKEGNRYLAQICSELSDGNLKESIKQAEGKSLLDFSAAEIPAVLGPSVMDEFNRKIKMACDCEETVLLTGESGSGKGFYASYIHAHSSRSKGKFIKQNMAELNPTLIESQLFGTEAHAYTGACKNKGLFELAQGGVFFMDEIGELPVEAQAKLLAVIEEEILRPIGSQNLVNLDVRLLFATNRNLVKEVESGNFRKDLLYRINAMEIHVPPLREHKEDVGSLAQFFASRKNKALASQTIALLERYDWPGNVRQLQSVVMVACNACPGPIVEKEYITL